MVIGVHLATPSTFNVNNDTQGHVSSHLVGCSPRRQEATVRVREISKIFNRVHYCKCYHRVTSAGWHINRLAKLPRQCTSVMNFRETSSILFKHPREMGGWRPSRPLLSHGTRYNLRHINNSLPGNADIKIMPNGNRFVKRLQIHYSIQRHHKYVYNNVVTTCGATFTSV